MTLYVNKFYNGKIFTNIPYFDIAKFCYDLGVSTTIELPESLNESCEIYDYRAHRNLRVR